MHPHASLEHHIWFSVRLPAFLFTKYKYLHTFFPDYCSCRMRFFIQASSDSKNVWHYSRSTKSYIHRLTSVPARQNSKYARYMPTWKTESYSVP